MTDTIVLLDGISDVKKLEKYVKDHNIKKICFDYSSYRYLRSSCSIVEEYFDEKSRNLLDNFVIELTTGWYKNKKIANSLEIQGVNIGYLLELELLPYFFHKLKRFIGVLNVIKKEEPKRIITASLGNFVLPTDKIEHLNHSTHSDNGLFYDNIEIPICIGSRTKTIKISREKYQSIKKIVDSIISSFFIKKFDPAKKTNRKNILLMEFNPENYFDLIRALANQKHNVILLNQRRPVITNLSSLKIVRSTGCKICQMPKAVPASQGLSYLWSNKAFEEIFSVDGRSFWNCIRVDFANVIEKRYFEIIHKVAGAESLLNNVRVDLILDWAHTATEEKIISSLAHAKNIPIITLQHGSYPTNENFSKYLPLQPIIPSENKIAVWGDIMKNYIVKHGGSNDSIIISGSPKHDKFFKNEKKKSNAVLIVVSELYHSNFEGTDTRIFERLDRYVMQLLILVRKLSDKGIIVKLRPSQTPYDIQATIDMRPPNISVYKTQDIYDVMQMCDTVISMNFSTAVLDAMILDKPTMTILPEKQGYEQDVIMKSDATVTVSNMEELESKLKEFLTDEDLRQKLVKNGQKIVQEYFTNHGKASAELAREINLHL